MGTYRTLQKRALVAAMLSTVMCGARSARVQILEFRGEQERTFPHPPGEGEEQLAIVYTNFRKRIVTRLLVVRVIPEK